jgi:hypothetical protein
VDLCEKKEVDGITKQKIKELFGNGNLLSKEANRIKKLLI